MYRIYIKSSLIDVIIYHVGLQDPLQPSIADSLSPFAFGVHQSHHANILPTSSVEPLTSDQAVLEQLQKMDADDVAQLMRASNPFLSDHTVEVSCVLCQREKRHVPLQNLLQASSEPADQATGNKSMLSVLTQVIMFLMHTVFFSCLS